jgi:plasmid maintenance system antidote protein VapI
MLDNIHPGEVLLEEFLQEYGISQNRLGREKLFMASAP